MPTKKVGKKRKVVTQTGFLFKITPTDYITGASPLVRKEVNVTSDWKGYAPVGEKQYMHATFDTMSCTTFSALNAIETWINWMIKSGSLPEATRTKLNELGFFADGKFNASDRFTAIMSGTMPNGNYFQNVIDSIRKDGLLPEALLPFGGRTQSEYLNKNLITPQMIETAKEFTKLFSVSYEWVSDIATLAQELKKCPVQVAIPKQATHAVVAISPVEQFDTYEPYIKPLPEVGYAMNIYVDVIEKPSEYQFRTLMKIGMRSEEVKRLQERLKKDGYFTFGSITGYFGSYTRSAVMSFQRNNGLFPDGIVGPKTQEVLNQTKKKVL
jgi:hypothetical protein